MNPHIFRQYDIRGKADRDLPDAFALDLGRALGTFWQRHGQRRVALGRDCRTSSDRLHAALLAGLQEAGCHVVDVGVVSTPLVYFAVFHLDLDGGVQITGSHNPPDENGFKMMKGKASLFGDDIQTLYSMLGARDFDLPGGGAVESQDVLPAYAAYMHGNVKLARRDVRFAIDAGNGTGGPVALAALRAVGLDPVALLCEMDGSFPVHHPDPSQPENLAMLRARVLEDGLELGIAYDGDADRIGVIDARGEVLWGDRLMVVLSRALLRDRPGAAIIGEVKCSQTLYDDIEAHGGRPIMWKTGHSLIKTKMKEEGALLAGEMSGHIFFADRYYGFDDAVYATLRLLEIVAGADKPLHELIADLPTTHSTPELRVDCPDAIKFDVVQRVLDHYRPTHQVIDVDGVRVQFDDGWGLVRASNTQPALVLRFEAQSPERLQAIRDDVESVVKASRDQSA
jgi:phosphomannomutase / phosphoglucomutase